MSKPPPINPFSLPAPVAKKEKSVAKAPASSASSSNSTEATKTTVPTSATASSTTNSQSTSNSLSQHTNPVVASKILTNRVPTPPNVIRAPTPPNVIRAPTPPNVIRAPTPPNVFRAPTPPQSRSITPPALIPTNASHQQKQQESAMDLKQILKNQNVHQKLEAEEEDEEDLDDGVDDDEDITDDDTNLQREITDEDKEKANLIKDALTKVHFDPSLFLDPYITGVDMAKQNNPENLLLTIFDDIMSKMKILAKNVEEEVSLQQEAAASADGILMDELDQHSAKLVEVRTSVDDIRKNFDRATSGAITIGERLAKSERERRRIESAMEWMKFIKLFESMPPEKYSELHMCNSDQLRASLPETLQKKDWGKVSHVLYELRRILFDINSDDVQIAQKNVIKLTEAIETELLGQFEVAVIELMDDPENESSIEKTKELAYWLHYYNNGQALQKRYVFAVIERRIPRDASFFVKSSKRSKEKDWKKRLGEKIGMNQSKIKTENNRRKNKRVSINDDEGDKDNDSSDGDSDNDENLPKSALQSFTTGGKSATGEGIIDHLSELFGNISAVCQEQFSIIRKIFPSTSVARITRLLIQRIFNDPAFGIQARVDAVLCPKPPAPPLNLSDYLDALTTVREKLSALYIVLLDYCTHPAMQGVGNEWDGGMNSVAGLELISAPSMNSIDNDKSSSNNNLLDLRGTNKGKSNIRGNLSGSNLIGDGVLNGTESHERMRSDAEVREFLEDQVSQVLAAYITDYFEKEMTNVKFQFSDSLKRSVDDPNLLTKVSVLSSLPRLRAEKLKSIAVLVKTVGNARFVNSIFSISTDSIMRMESIGRDDKKLPVKVKELFLLELEFLVDCLFLPWTTYCTTTLLKVAATRASSSALPPMEFLSALSALYSGVARLKSHFDEVFLRPLGAQPNLIIVCKEGRRKALKLLESAAKGSLNAWTMCVSLHLEKTLATVQSKYDFAPKFEQVASSLSLTSGKGGSSTVSSTNACNTICKSILLICNNIRFYQSDLVGLNINEEFWKPLGQQFIGCLITHIKKLKVSMEGGKILHKDLDEYCHVSAVMEVPETIDMIMCLKEISLVYRVQPEKVVKVIVEDLRHLDTAVVLGLAFARSDSTGFNRGPNHWTKLLSDSYGSIKWDAPLPWEGKKHLTVMSFNDSFVTSGPKTLRKSSSPLSSLLLLEAARAGGSMMMANNMMMTGAGKGEENMNPRVVPNPIEFSTQFAPSRPDGVEAKPSKLTEMPALPSSNNFFMSRPDLIGQQQQQQQPHRRGSVGITPAQSHHASSNGNNNSNVASFGEATSHAFDKLGGNMKQGFSAMASGIMSIGVDNNLKAVNPNNTSNNNSSSSSSNNKTNHSNTGNINGKGEGKKQKRSSVSPPSSSHVTIAPQNIPTPSTSTSHDSKSSSSSIMSSMSSFFKR